MRHLRTSDPHRCPLHYFSKQRFKYGCGQAVHLRQIASGFFVVKLIRHLAIGRFNKKTSYLENDTLRHLRQGASRKGMRMSAMISYPPHLIIYIYEKHIRLG